MATKKTEMLAEEVKAKASTRKKSKTNTRDTRAAVETASTHASKLNTMLLFHIGIIAFLVLNAFLSISLLLRVNQLTERNRLGNWGNENMQKLWALYNSAAYSSYFADEISLLENKLSQYTTNVTP